MANAPSHSDLKIVADAFEASNGAGFPGNASEAGYWRRAALAAEAATVTSPPANANPTVEGYMNRVARALEKKAGTTVTGPQGKNPTYDGLLTRITNAMALIRGSSGTGSLGNRLRALAPGIVLK